MNIGVLGYGFVGKAVAQLSSSFAVEIYDPNVPEYSDNKAAFSQDIVFVCVPTPPDKNGALDTSIVEDVTHRWSKESGSESILVIKSTIPVGATERLKRELGTDRIVHNPEFLTERTAMQDFLNPQEVIVGGCSPITATVVELYKSFYGTQDVQYFAVPSVTAEMIKMARNSFYALKVSYFNEIYELCSATGQDYDDFREVFTLGGKHPWIGNQHVSVPGPDGKFGYGGKCLPKDSEGLLKTAEKHGIVMETLKAAVKANKKRRIK